ncbi:hypothetical protein [Hoeflea sp.]|uniref:hypothetical protein n=1 Tax=Hoeflea sp. TaxID=1940281 RepID=UPI003B02E793
MSKGRRSALAIPDILEHLKSGRAGAAKVMAGVRPFGDTYKKASALADAIDDLTEDLTGDRERFWEKGQG